MTISKEVKIGALVAIAIIVFFVGFAFLKNSSIFSSAKDYYVFYENVEGLQVSAPVQIKGLGIGKVTEITLSNERPGMVKVVLEIPDETKIPMGSVAQLTSFDLLGTKGIAMQLSGSTTEAPDNSELTGAIEGGIIDKVSSEITPLLQDLRGVVFLVDSVLLSVNQILNENTRRELQGSIASLNKTMSNFNEISTKLNGQSDQMVSVIRNANSFTNNIVKNNDNIDKIIRNAKTTTDQLAAAPIESTVNKLNATADDLSKVIAKMNSSDGTLGKIINDKQLYNDLNGTLQNLSELAADLKAHPARYINVTIFGKKRHVGE